MTSACKVICQKESWRNLNSLSDWLFHYHFELRLKSFFLRYVMIATKVERTLRQMKLTICCEKNRNEKFRKEMDVFYEVQTWTKKFVRAPRVSEIMNGKSVPAVHSERPRHSLQAFRLFTPSI